MRVVRAWVRAVGAQVAGRRWWLAAVGGGLLAVIVLVTVVAVRAGDGERPPSRTLGTWVEPDQFDRTPACDGFGRKTLTTLGPLPASDRTASHSHSYCGWPQAADGFLYVMVNVHPADGSGAATATRWLAGEPGEVVAEPRIGDAAKLEEYDGGCTLQFRRSNLIARIGFIADSGGDCRTRIVALGAEFASRLPR